MTKAALLTPGENIETAWFLDDDWVSVRRLIRPLGAKWYRVTGVDFEDQPISAPAAWMPLRQAVYDPLERVLVVEWKDPAAKSITELRYADTPLKLQDGGTVAGLDLVGGIAWIVTRNRKDGAEGYCPIKVPVETRPACDDGPAVRSPEDWLRMLGAVMSGDRTGAQHTHASPTYGEKQGTTSGFESSERVRDLAARMRYLEETLCEEGLSTVQRDWLRTLAEQIYKVHDPSCCTDSHEQVWRAWVRLELWQAAERVSERIRPTRERAFWRDRATAFRRLGIKKLPDPLRNQFLAAIRGLREGI